MSLSATHLVLMVLAALVVTPPLVLLIPHARQSPTFDRMLWAGTLLTAFLGTWLGIANWSNTWPEPSINSVPILPIFAGALGGAFLINALLWILDRLETPVIPDDGFEDELPPEPEQPTEPETANRPEHK